ncbi:MAG: ATP-binding cassette domain-containing protein [Candidatus Eisenbacteria bacterium]|nr:ATP-binding cassette domain-containing protein [Candidatus Latescibacterota bacterium]MBD3302956.1 ATP-binding cassette domain-containing protein [Candidatus Eisenbacteria bacterium]
MNTAVSAPPVQADGLTRDFGSVRAVSELTFRVDRGEIVGLLGPNGAGKTTTLRMLTGSLIPTAGSVRLCGFDVLREGPQARARLGFLPEQMPLYGEMTVRDFLGFVAGIKDPSRRIGRERIAPLRERLDLGAVWDRPTRVLSRGFRQRVGLAQALLGDPDLLILDEPTAGLDPNQIREFRSTVRDLGREHAILLSTHILPEALEVCDRVMILNQGRLVAVDRPDRLAGTASPEGKLIGRVRSPAPPQLEDPGARVLDETGGLWRIEGDWDQRESDAALRALLDGGAEVLEWRRGTAGLEEVFRRLTLGEGGS